MKEPYSSYYVLNAEGRRVAICTCSQCGAALILDGSEKVHTKWHANELEASRRAYQEQHFPPTFD